MTGSMKRYRQEWCSSPSVLSSGSRGGFPERQPTLPCLEEGHPAGPPSPDRGRIANLPAPHRGPFEHRVGEGRPRVERPGPELPVGDRGGADSGDGIDPQERARTTEVPERLRRVPRASPVRSFVVADLEGEPPRVRVEPPDLGEDARELRELRARRFVERLLRDERGRKELAREGHQVSDTAPDFVCR